MNPTTRETIAASIRSLGVKPGDLMMAHSSFKSFGGVEGGPTAVAQALVDAVSPGGSVFVPTFNYAYDVYDPATAPSYDGAITEHFRKLPGAVRSLHPTHPLAGIGPDAGAILAGHDAVHAFGTGSPCWRLWERDAWVLLIGVGHSADSVAHVAEEVVGVPYLHRFGAPRVRRVDGTIATVHVRRPGCSGAWNDVLEPPLQARGAVRIGSAGAARLKLVRAREVVDVAVGLLRADPEALLCKRDGCTMCAEARELMRQHARTHAAAAGTAD